jgi:hypothetical protein
LNLQRASELIDRPFFVSRNLVDGQEIVGWEPEFLELLGP